MPQYFPKSYEPFGGDINVKVDLSNYATKANLKIISHFDTSSFTLKTNLANLKTEIDKLDIDKLLPVLVDLSKLSDVVKNDVVKKDVYDKLVTKVNAIDTSTFVLKPKYDTDKSELENKIPDTSGLAKKTDYNTKIIEIVGKIPDISNLATKTALTSAENKLPSVSSLATKTSLTTVESKIPEISNLAKKKTALNTVENKTPDINNLATKTALTTVKNKIPDVNSLVKKTSYNTKISSLDGKIAKINFNIQEFSKGSLLLFFGKCNV